jgi:hypothetical protein
LREASYFSLSMVPEPTQWTTEEKAEAKSYPETIDDQASFLLKKPRHQSHTFLRQQTNLYLLTLGFLGLGFTKILVAFGYSGLVCLIMG